jgi:MOSC domain-containing protein YiiM
VLTGSIVQINVSPSGLPKRPVREATLTPLGFAGDAQAHPDVHGGPLKAVLLIPAEITDELAARGFPLFYGALGENLTTRGLDIRELRAGMRLRLPDAMIELTQLRKPCAELDIYGAALSRAIEDDPPLGGYYARVVRAGTVKVNDIISVSDVAV